MLCLLHGATFLGLKTTDELRLTARTPPRAGSAWATVAVVVAFSVWTVVIADTRLGADRGAGARARVGVLAATWAVRRGRDGRAFVLTAMAMACDRGGAVRQPLSQRARVQHRRGEQPDGGRTPPSADYALTVMTRHGGGVLPAGAALPGLGVRRFPPPAECVRNFRTERRHPSRMMNLAGPRRWMEIWQATSTMT